MSSCSLKATERIIFRSTFTSSIHHTEFHTKMPPQLIFGTASFGMDMTDFQDEEAVNTLLKTIRDLDIARLDTGARYPPLNPGLSETLIGKTRTSSEAFLVDTKVFTDTRTDGSGDLKREAIEKSVVGSLERLQRPGGVSLSVVDATNFTHSIP